MDDDTVATAELIAAYEMVLRHQQVVCDEAELLQLRTSDFINSLQARLNIIRDIKDPNAEVKSNAR